MKHLLPALFLLVFTASLSAQIYKADTTVYESWANNAWQLSNRSISTYNEGCQEVSSLSQRFIGSSWINSSLYTYSYASGDHLSEYLLQNWNISSNSWDNYVKSTFTYNGSFKVLTQATQVWEAGVEHFNRITYSYNANGYIISTLSETSLDGVTWTNETLTTFTNNTDGTANQVVRQNWNPGTMSWNNDSRTSNTYNADKTVHQTIVELWIEGLNWVSANRLSFTYDFQGRQLTLLYEVWQGAWVNSALLTRSYNGSGQLTSDLYQSWNNSSFAWANIRRTDYTYGANGSLFQSVLQLANANTNFQLVNNGRATYHYNTGCILPLTLLDFTATLSGKDVLLKWTTTKEKNTSYFEIESSRDAARFEKIGSVKAATSSTQKINYQFVDANPTALAPGKIFYRLKMIDKDGKFSYSKIAFAGLPPGQNLFSIFPNAVSDNLFVLYNSQNAVKAEVRIIDQSGRQVYRQQVKPAGNQVNINVSKLNAGLYYLELVTNEGIKSSKFIKL